jgi:hypothetical protein
MNALNDSIWWGLGGVVALLMIGYLVMEYIAWLDRTAVVVVPAGLRFVARGLQVEMQRNKARLIVQATNGHYSQQTDKQTPPKETHGALTATFEALGLRMQVVPEMHKIPGKEGEHATGYCTLFFDAANTHTRLRVERIPRKVATDFEQFATQTAIWIEKLEARQAQEEEAKAKAEADALASAAAAAAKKATGATAKEVTELTPDAQVAQWRKAAGFSGISSEIGLDDKGGIQWYVDLNGDARITLHSDRRTVHTTLAGAEIKSLGGELEIGVRDDFWTPSEPELRRFRILKGRSPDERRAWKERLEILRNQLEAQTSGSR